MDFCFGLCFPHHIFWFVWLWERNRNVFENRQDYWQAITYVAIRAQISYVIIFLFGPKTQSALEATTIDPNASRRNFCAHMFKSNSFWAEMVGRIERILLSFQTTTLSSCKVDIVETWIWILIWGEFSIEFFITRSALARPKHTHWHGIQSFRSKVKHFMSVQVCASNENAERWQT